MFKYSRRIQLDKALGQDYRYESAEFTAEAKTKKEAEQEVNDWIKDFIKEKKEEIKRKSLEAPF